jgi:hypothetical protein
MKTKEYVKKIFNIPYLSAPKLELKMGDVRSRPIFARIIIHRYFGFSFIMKSVNLTQNLLVEVSVYSKEENSLDFCPNYVQEFRHIGRVWLNS